MSSPARSSLSRQKLVGPLFSLSPFYALKVYMSSTPLAPLCRAAAVPCHRLTSHGRPVLVQKGEARPIKFVRRAIINLINEDDFQFQFSIYVNIYFLIWTSQLVHWSGLVFVRICNARFKPRPRRAMHSE